jgi:hypothetical protein
MFAAMAYLVSVASWVPFSVAGIKELSGERILDVRPPYGSDEGYRTLDALEALGRQRYDWYLVADVVFIVVYTAALAGAIFAGFGKGRLATGLAIVPFVAAGFDVVEDASVFAALRAFPGASSGALEIASVAGLGKFVFFYSALVIAVGGGVVWVVRAVRKRRGRPW